MKTLDLPDRILALTRGDVRRFSEAGLGLEQQRGGLTVALLVEFSLSLVPGLLCGTPVFRSEKVGVLLLRLLHRFFGPGDLIIRPGTAAREQEHERKGQEEGNNERSFH